MTDPDQRGITSGGRGVLLIGCTYVYFLIFAQFGFLKRLGELHIGIDSLTPVMAAMAVGGVLSSLFGQRILRRFHPTARLRAGLLGCALAAALTLLPLTPFAAGCVAALIGVALGLLTVTLVSHLNLWMGSRSPLVRVALGTGVGYFICNIPALFNATPNAIALVSALVCLLAVFFVHEEPRSQPTTPLQQFTVPFGFVLLAFTALIWLDSAAFYIIQNSPALKTGTWAGSFHLWRNGVIHLVAALASAWLIRRRGLLTTLLAAFSCIAAASLLLHHSTSAALAPLFYPAGVSLYSVALVAYPSLLLAARSSNERERQAGVIYAIAGWIGSAMGIGMGQHLHRVPTPFILIAGLAVAAPFAWKLLQKNTAPVCAAIALATTAGVLHYASSRKAQSSSSAHDSEITRGRHVYIAEGCIHCHSQYIRPNNAADVSLWGPSRDIETIRREHPPLIGNRRQGPDLSEVGGRRSPLWLRIHFINPRDVSYRSIMPSYAYLFQDGRGNALIAYLESLKSPDDAKHLREELASWTPASGSVRIPQVSTGEQVFQNNCATCHVPTGTVRRKYGQLFRVVPPDVLRDNLNLISSNASAEQQILQLERIIKFGLPGSDMPGHEYLSDRDIVTLADWLVHMRAQATLRP